MNEVQDRLDVLRRKAGYTPQTIAWERQRDIICDYVHCPSRGRIQDCVLKTFKGCLQYRSPEA